jgi:hypothetical protein
MASALADQLQALDPDNTDIVLTRLNLACWRKEAGDPDAAMNALQELLPKAVRLPGPNHYITAAIRENLR